MPGLGMGLGVPKGSFGDSGLLLDELSENVEVAFSLRKVRAEYNGPCVRVRNSSGTLKDIGFLSNGSIDEAALNAHCGSNDGTVHTWYNQSAEGGQYNAVQDTPANQPIIYDASEGGYLGYLENTGDMYLRFENQLTGVTDLAAVYENVSSTTSSAYVLGEHRSDGNASNGVSVGHPSVPGFSLVSSTNLVSNTGDDIGGKHAGFGYTSNSNKFVVVDGYVAGSTTGTLGSMSIDYIFARSKSGSPGNWDFLGKVWEVFLSTSDLSANRIQLENSILSANGLTVPEQTLLEKYDGAEGAFSTRCINREHVGPILRVRNEVDHALRVVVDEDNLGDTDSRLGISKTVPGVSNADTYTVTFEVYADCPSVTGNVNLSAQVGAANRFTTPTSVTQNQWVSVSIDSGALPDNGAFRVYFAGTTLQSLDSGDRIYFRNFDYDHANGGDAVSYDSDFSSDVDGFTKSGTESGDFTLGGGLGSSPIKNIYLQSDGTLNTDYLETQCTLVTDKFDGFVMTWFDQSGSGNDATQTTTASNPKIYDATDGVVLLNGKPAVEFDGSDDILESSSQAINTEAIIAVASTNNEVTGAQHIIRQGTAFIRFDGNNKVEYRNNVNLRNDDANNCPGLTNDNAALVSWYTKGTGFNDANASWKWYFNGDLLGTQTGNNLSSESGPIKIGAQSTTSERLNGKVCEAIIIDKRNAHYDRADQIHKDINAHYLIYQEATASPTSGFLADYSGAAAAYSVRQLGDANLCMRVRRDGDDAEKNIGFGTDGFVDTTAISDFCGTDNGFVVTWFDQSGNAVDATQGTAAEQPKIYDGTDGVTKDNGYPATEWSAASGQSLETTYTTDSSEFTVVAVANGDDSLTNKTIVLTPEALVLLGSDERAKHIQGNGLQTSYSIADFNDQAIHFVGNSGSESFAGENGDTLTTLSESTSTNSLLRIGNNANKGIPFLGTIQEIVYYISDQSSSRTAIEENVNDAFTVHPDADTTPESGFLNEFSGAAAAYSVRKLGDSPVAMRVRKTVSSVDYYQVIGFDSNGDLDTAAIEEFGGSNDVFVQTWYDQSGNGRHVTQDTADDQPKIYDGTDGIVYENGSAALDFDGTNDTLKYSGFSKTVLTAFNVAKPNQTNSRSSLLSFVDNAANFFFRYSEDGTMTAACNGGFSTTANYTASQNLTFVLFGTSLAVGYNGEAVETGSGTGRTSEDIIIGEKGSGDRFNGNVQEVVIYDSDQSSNREDIETNINNYFLIHQEASASPATGLLSETPNAVAAYSVRQLGDAKLCMKVRRGSDNATKNIGFKSGVLDTAAIEAFCGNSDGTVDTWYDQSGNGYHATQGTGTAQPKIYDNATGIVTDNGKTALEFDSANSQALVNTSSSMASQLNGSDITFIQCVSGDSLASFADSTASNRMVGLGSNATDGTRAFQYNNTFYASVIGFLDPRIEMGFIDSTTKKALVRGNGTDGNESLATNSTLNQGNNLTIGSLGDSTPSYADGKVLELVVYDSYKFSDREDIETNINNHFKVFTPFTTGLLDSYPGAAAAYSLRRLSSTYTGPAIEVTSDGSTQDIGFDAEGNLDTVAIKNFCGSNDGTVSKWYDQSGNSNDLVQATVNDQPKVYDGSDGVVTISDQPAVNFYESNGKFLSTSSNFSFDDFFVLNVIKASVHSGSDPVVWSIGLGSDSEYQYLANLNAGDDYYIRYDVSGTNSARYVGSHRDFEGPHNIVSLSYDQTNPVLRINAKVEFDDAHSGVYGADNQPITLGALGTGGGQPFRGKQQEFLVYPSDMRTKVAGIEKNINKHYSIYDQPLLDVVPDAAAAYSLRRLKSDYTGPAINVYNGTDYKDIYFKANGTLDTNAISKFCGSNDGTVAIWYDQSGNDNHAEQAVAIRRPKVYDGTNGLLTESGLPIMEFVDDDTSIDDQTFDFNFPDLRNQSEFHAYIASTTSDPTYLLFYEDGNTYSFVSQNNSNLTQKSQEYGSPTLRVNGSQQTIDVNTTRDDIHGYLDGKTIQVHNASTLGWTEFNAFNYRRDVPTDFYGYSGKVYEMIFYNTDVSASNEVIEANINHYYSIY